MVARAAGGASRPAHAARDEPGTPASASRWRARSGPSPTPPTSRAARAWTAATCRCWPAANALAALAGHRRQALWQAVGAVPDKDLLRPAGLVEETPVLAAPSEGQEIVGDYRAQGLTLGRHPLALLRPQLLAKRFLPADVLMDFANGQLARACGIVTVRQRPGTAKGVLFLTIEDETGNVNVIVWASLVEQQRREVLNAHLLGVYGVWQREGEVRHLVAKRLVDMSHLLGNLDTRSRDFC